MSFVDENRDVWDETASEQLRCLWTAMILHTDSVEVDTSEYDNMLNQVWDKFSEPAGSKLGYFDKEDFENYMCKHLV